MTGTEYRLVLDQLGLNQQQAAELLGIDARTSRRYALGETVPAPVERFLTFLVRSKTSPGRVLSLLQG